MTSPHFAHCSFNSKMPVPAFVSKYEPQSAYGENNFVSTHENKKCQVIITKMPPKLELRLQQQRRIKMHLFLKYFRSVLETHSPKERLHASPAKTKCKKKRERGSTSTGMASLGKAPGKRTHRPILQELLNVDENTPSPSVIKDENKAVGCQARGLEAAFSDQSQNETNKTEEMPCANSGNDQELPSGISSHNRSIQSNDLPLTSCHSPNTYCDTKTHLQPSLTPNCKETTSLPKNKLHITSARKCSKSQSANKSLDFRGELSSTCSSSSSRKPPDHAANFGIDKFSSHITTNYRAVTDCNTPNTNCESSARFTEKQTQKTVKPATNQCFLKREGSSLKETTEHHRVAGETDAKPNILNCNTKEPSTSNSSKTFLLDSGKIVQREWLERLKCISKAVRSEKNPRGKMPSVSETGAMVSECQKAKTESTCHTLQLSEKTVSLGNTSTKDVLCPDIKPAMVSSTEQQKEVTTVSTNLAKGHCERIPRSDLAICSTAQHATTLEHDRCNRDSKVSIHATVVSNELEQNSRTPENAQTLCVRNDLPNHVNKSTNLMSSNEQVTNKLQDTHSNCRNIECELVNSGPAHDNIKYTHAQQTQTNSQCSTKESPPLMEEEPQLNCEVNSKVSKDDVGIQDSLYGNLIAVSSLEGTFQTNEQSFIDVSAIPDHSECPIYAPTSQTEECDVPITPPVDTKDILSRVMTAVFFSDEDEPEDVILSRTAIDSAYKSLTTNGDFKKSGTLRQFQTENSLSPTTASKTFYQGYCIGDGSIKNMVHNLLADLVTSVCHICDSSPDSFHKKDSDLMKQEGLLRETMEFRDGVICITEGPHTSASIQEPDSNVEAENDCVDIVLKHSSSARYNDCPVECEDGGIETKLLHGADEVEYCDDACSNNTDFVSLKLSSGYDTEEEETPRPPSRTSSMFHSDLVSDEEGEINFQHQQESFSLRSSSPISDIECTVRKVTDDILDWIETGQKVMRYPIDISPDHFDVQQSLADSVESSNSGLPIKSVTRFEGNECVTLYAGEEEYDAGEEDEGFMQLPCIESVYSIRGDVTKDFFAKSPCEDDTESKPIAYDIASPDGNWSEQDMYDNEGLRRTSGDPEIYYSNCNDSSIYQSDIHDLQTTNSDPSNNKMDTDISKLNDSKDSTRTSSTNTGGEKVLDTWAAEMETEQHISKIVTHVMFSILKKCEDAVDACGLEKGHIPVQVVTKSTSRVEKAKPSADTEQNKISLKLSLKRIQEMSNTKHVRKITRRMNRLSLEEEEEEEEEETHNSASPEESNDTSQIKPKNNLLESDKEVIKENLKEPSFATERDENCPNADSVSKSTSPSLRLSPLENPRTPSPFYLCYARIDSNHVIKSVNCEENEANDEEKTPSEDTNTKLQLPYVSEVKDGLGKFFMSRVHDGKSTKDWKITSVHKNPDLVPINIQLLDKMADDVGKEFFFDQDETKSFKESAKIILSTPGKQQPIKKRKKRQKKACAETKKIKTKKESDDNEVSNSKTIVEKPDGEHENVSSEDGIQTKEKETSTDNISSLKESVIVEEDTPSPSAWYFSDEDELVTPPVTTDANSDEDGDYSPGVCTIAMQSELVARFLRYKRKDRRSTRAQDPDLDSMLTRMRSLRNSGGNDVMEVDFDNPIPLEYKQCRKKRPATSASEEGTEASSKPKSTDSPKKRRKLFTKTKLKKIFKRKQHQHKEVQANASPVHKANLNNDALDFSTENMRRRKFFRSRDAYSQSKLHPLQEEPSTKLEREQPSSPGKQVIQDAKPANSGLYDFDDEEARKTPPKPADIHPVSAKADNNSSSLSKPKPKPAADCSRPKGSRAIAADKKKDDDGEIDLSWLHLPVDKTKKPAAVAESKTKADHLPSPPCSPSPEIVVQTKKQTTHNYDDMSDSADEGEGRLLIVVDTDEEEAKDTPTSTAEVKSVAKEPATEKIPAPQTLPVVTSNINLNTNVLPVLQSTSAPVIGSNTNTVSSTTLISSVVLPIVSNSSVPVDVRSSPAVSVATRTPYTTLVSVPSVSSSSLVLNPASSSSLPTSHINQPVIVSSSMTLANQIAAACLRASTSMAAMGQPSALPTVGQPPLGLPTVALPPTVLSTVALPPTVLTTVSQPLVGQPLVAQPLVVQSSAARPSTITSLTTQATTVGAPVAWPPVQARQSLAGIQTLPTAPEANKDCTSQYERLKNELMMLEMVALQKERERNNILRLKQYKQNIMRKLQLKKSMMQGNAASPDGAAIPQQSPPPAIQNILKTMVLQQAALHAAASNANALRQQALFSTSTAGTNPQQLQLSFLNPSASTALTATTGAKTATSPLTTTVITTGSQRVPDTSSVTNVLTPDLTKGPLQFVPSPISSPKVVDPATSAAMMLEWKKRLKLLAGGADPNQSLSSVDTIVAKANENFGLQIQDWLKEATRAYLEQQSQLANLQQAQLGMISASQTMTSSTSSPSQSLPAPNPSHLSALQNPAAAAAATDKRQHMSIDDVIRNVYSRRMNIPKPTALPATTSNLGYVQIPVIRGPHPQATLPAGYPSMTVTSLPAPNVVTAPIVRPSADLGFPVISLGNQARPMTNPNNPPAFLPVNNKDLTNILNNKAYNPPSTSTLAQLLMTPPADRPEQKEKETEDRSNDVTIVGEQPANPLASKADKLVTYPRPAHQEPAAEAASSSRNWANRTARKLYPKWPNCQGCKAELARFICAGCNNQWYCSETCQVKHWKVHFRTCHSRR